MLVLCSFLSPGLRSKDLDGTLEELVLEAERDGHEDEVEDEHAEAHPLRHLPPEDQDGEEDLKREDMSYTMILEYLNQKMYFQ